MNKKLIDRLVKSVEAVYKKHKLAEKEEEADKAIEALEQILIDAGAIGEDLKLYAVQTMEK